MDLNVSSSSDQVSIQEWDETPEDSSSAMEQALNNSSQVNSKY